VNDFDVPAAAVVTLLNVINGMQGVYSKLTCKMWLIQLEVYSVWLKCGENRCGR